MNRRFVLYPYKVASESAHRLKDSFKEAGESAIIVYPDRAYECKAGDVVIGWGNSKQPNWSGTIGKAAMVLNLWSNIKNSVDKKRAFACFTAKGICIPEPTVSIVKAAGWLAKGHVVIGRKTLQGMKGTGIEVLMPDKEYEDENFGDFKLFTKFIPDTTEYRVYTFGNKVIDVLEKRRESGTNDPGYVRNEENGWVFCRQHVHLPEDCAKEAVKATKALGLHFSGVDILWSKPEKKAFVLETNTCPDIFGSGVKVFRDTFIDYCKGGA